MKLFGALALFTAVNTAPNRVKLEAAKLFHGHKDQTAFGLDCYMCAAPKIVSCNTTVNCEKTFNFSDPNFLNQSGLSGIPGFPDLIDLTDMSYRCYRTEMFGLEVMGCMIKQACIIPSIRCCEGELCNSAPQAPPPAPLLLGLAAFIALRRSQEDLHFT